MTTVNQEPSADCPAEVEGEGGSDARQRPRSAQRLVGVTFALGGVALVLALTYANTEGSTFRIEWASNVALTIGLVVLTCAAELVAVRVRHGDDAVEELTLLDGVVLLNTLVLPVRHALLVSLIGLVIAYLIRRRPAVKMLYNLGVYASASAATAAVVHLIVPGTGALDVRLMVALVAGSTVFVAINLAHMSLLLGVISDVRPWQVVREDAPLSMLTILGTVALTGTGLALAVAAPALLPCAVLPAVALRHAYTASADRYEQRRRSGRVLKYSQVLASGPTRSDAIAALLHLVHEEFGEAAALAAFDDGPAVQLESGTSTLTPAALGREALQFLAASQLSLLQPKELPLGWHSGMAAPIVAEGRRIGTIAVGSNDGSRLRPADLTTLSTLVSSLAVALQNADNVAQLVEETSKLRAVVDQAGDGIVVLGRRGVIQIWSPAMERITGVCAAQATGSRLPDVLTRLDVPDLEPSAIADGEVRPTPDSPHVTVDVRLRRLNGETRSTQFSHAALFEGSVLVRDVVIVRDLTAEWRVQRMKSDFIATVSHELRTPLTPLKGYATLLRNRGETLPAEKRERALDVIIERAEHMARLVEDLLAASSLNEDEEPRHSLVTEVTDLTALARRACQDFPTAPARIRIDAAEDLLVTCDPTRALQVASNLISNALKYSHPDTEILLTVDRFEEYGWLAVTDRGHGIPVDEIDRIFDKFHRVEDPMIMSTGGTGLGLFIARQLARAMHGDLTGESSLGVGSRFLFTLPLAPAQ